jgi:hypothetical protein
MNKTEGARGVSRAQARAIGAMGVTLTITRTVPMANLYNQSLS